MPDLIKRLIKELSVNVTIYATVAELYAETDLPVGYYEVTGVGVTYWNGLIFDPPLTQLAPGIVTVNDGLVYLADAVTADAVVAFGPWPYYPQIHDYAGLYTDSLLRSADPGTVDPTQIGILHSFTRITANIVGNVALELKTDLSIRAIVRHIATDTATDINVIDYANSGETEAANNLWNLNIQDDRLRSFAESGAGVDGQADWFFPFWPVDTGVRAYAYELRRVASVETAYVNGLQLRYIISNTAGSVNNTTGEYSRVTPTGGTTNVINSASSFGDADGDIVLAMVGTDGTSIPTPAIFAANAFCEFPAQELSDLFYDDFATKAAHANIIALLRPISTGIEDVAGTITAWATNTIVSQVLVADGSTDQYWGISGGATVSAANTALQIAGDLTVNVVTIVRAAASSTLFECSATGETLGTNVLYMYGAGGSTATMFYEYDAGVNNTVTWTLATALQLNEIVELRWTRTEIGGGNSELRCYQRMFGSTTWSQLIVASLTAGSGVTTGVATVPSTITSAGGTQNLRLTPTSFFWREIAIFDAVVTP